MRSSELSPVTSLSTSLSASQKSAQIKRLQFPRRKPSETKNRGNEGEIDELAEKRAKREAIRFVAHKNECKSKKREEKGERRGEEREEERRCLLSYLFPLTPPFFSCRPKTHRMSSQAVLGPFRKLPQFPGVKKLMVDFRDFYASPGNWPFALGGLIATAILAETSLHVPGTFISPPIFIVQIFHSSEDTCV